MADIKIIVDTTSLVDAKKKLTAFQAQMGKTQSILGLTRALGSVERNVQDLIKAQEKGRLSQRAFQQGLLEQRKALEAMGMSSYMARKRVEELAQAIRNQEATRRAAQAAEEAAAATKRLADRQLELRMRFQEGYAQFTRQREAMRSLREAYRSGIITLAQYEAQLARIRAINQGNVAGTNNLGVAMQQTGYQVGDFMVQIQGGTNPMVAFGQQATQLVGVLYLLPPATLAASRSIMGLSVSVGFLVMSLGIIIPIATAIGAYFMRMSGSSKNLSQRIDELEATTQKVTSAFEMLADTELDEKFGDTTNAIRSMAAAMLELNGAAQLKNLTDSIGAIEKEGKAGAITKYFKGMASGLTFGLLGAGEQQANEEAFAKLGFDMSFATFEGYTQNLKALASSGDRGGVVQAFTAFLKDASDNGAELTSQGIALAREMYRVALATAEVNAELNGSAKAARVSALLEEKRVESIELYYYNLQKVSDLQQERKDGVKEILDAVEAEKKSMTDTLALNQLILKFGEDSAQVRAKEAEIAREQYRLELMAAKIKGNHLIEAMALYDENAKVTAELAASEDKAKGLADALKDAASAMANLLNMGSLEAKLAGLVAEVKAIETGANRVAAGYVASETVKAAQLRDTALAAGEMPQSLINQAYADRIAKINEVGAATAQRDAALANQREANKSGGKSEAEQLAERIANFEQQLQLEEALIGKSEERKRIIQALGVEFVNQNATAVANYEAQIEAITEATRLEEQRKSIMASVESSMESGFMAMVDGTKSVKDAFKDMAREIIKELYRVLVVKRMVGAISGGMGSLGSLFSGPAPGSTASILGTVNANGNAFFGGRLTPFANGGIVGGPTMFPMAGGKTGLMGEAGPEAIMPLKRDKNGRLGVSVDGGSGSVVVNNNINVTVGSDPAAIRMEVAKLMPQITAATKTAVIDARRRGGQMKATFG